MTNEQKDKNEEIERILRDTSASVAMEGYSVDKETIDQTRRMLLGEITMEELIHWIVYEHSSTEIK